MLLVGVKCGDPPQEKDLATQIGDLLTEVVHLDPEKIERALRLQKEDGDRLGTLLVRLGYMGERDLARALSAQLDLPLVDKSEYGDLAVLDGQVTAEFLTQSRGVPLSQDEVSLVVAMADPLDDFAAQALAFATGKQVQRRVGVGADIDSALARQMGDDHDASGALEPSEADAADVQHLKDLASEAPVIRFVNQLIIRAIEQEASDIHIETFEGELKVRHRVDGKLHEMPAPTNQPGAAVNSRIKVIANLDIAERRRPQDGRARIRIEGHELDVRVSTVPTLHGESVVLRLLDKATVPLEFDGLGFTPTMLERFEHVLEQPHGVVLVTGPTGSGKTTTLYAALRQLNTEDRKILTVEDPVEYQLAGINQIQVKPSIGLTFASSLRSLLRQDPDVIMVGEMRDLETARIAVQAALTGHKVFSTLHTNDAPSTITRLKEMGVEDYLIASTVNGVVAQRLVRVLCSRCKQPYDMPPAQSEKLGLAASSGGTSTYRARGCAACSHSGYRGRVAILELLTMSDALREALSTFHDAGTLRRIARAEGMSSMHQDGMSKVLAGVTTIEEVARVTQET